MLDETAKGVFTIAVTPFKPNGWPLVLDRLNHLPPFSMIFSCFPGRTEEESPWSEFLSI